MSRENPVQFNVSSGPAWLLLIGAAFIAACLPASGQVVNFNNGNDAGWTHYDPTSSLPGVTPATYSFPSGAYEISVPASPDPTDYGPARAGSIREDVTYSRFSAAIDLIAFNGTSNDEALGLVSRVSNIDLGTTVGYAFTYGTGGHDIDINRITSEQNMLLSRTQVTLDLTALSATEHYRMVFTGNGSQLTGTVYLVNTSNESDTSDPLASISATDGTYASGYSGLVAFDNTPSPGSAGADATFDNYAASVPEPSGLFLLCAGVAMAICPRRGARFDFSPGAR